jgi:hypothetical protein
MGNPPSALTLEAQKIAARTRKMRKFFVFLRERRHELLDADFQNTLAKSYSQAPPGKAPVEALAGAAPESLGACVSHASCVQSPHAGGSSLPRTVCGSRLYTQKCRSGKSTWSLQFSCPRS